MGVTVDLVAHPRWRISIRPTDQIRGYALIDIAEIVAGIYLAVRPDVIPTLTPVLS